VSERAVHEREEAWIAKYRAALHDTPAEKSLFESLGEAVQQICAKILRYGAKIFGSIPALGKNPQKSAAGIKKTSRDSQSDRAKKTMAS
jgi:hypothetical protein